MQQKSISAPFLQILLLAGLIAAVAAPNRLPAQQATPVATPAALTTASTDAAKAEAPKEQEDQEAVFRLEGPVVKWTAKTLNLSRDTAATIFDLINFSIVALLVGVPLARVLPKVVRGRREKVAIDLEAARKATAEAQARLSAIEAKLSGLDEEINQIRAQVEEESQKDEARIKATIGVESARIVAAAEQEIESSAAQARRSLRHFAADLAIDQAAKQLSFTEETDRALMAEFLGDATLAGASSGKAANKGGQK
jgi:F-type H+-transporting ATPase subunit b